MAACLSHGLQPGICQVSELLETLLLPSPMHQSPGLEEELVDCSGGDEILLEACTQRKLEALMQVRCWGRRGRGGARYSTAEHCTL